VQGILPEQHLLEMLYHVKLFPFPTMWSRIHCPVIFDTEKSTKMATFQRHLPIGMGDDLKRFPFTTMRRSIDRQRFVDAKISSVMTFNSRTMKLVQRKLFPLKTVFSCIDGIISIDTQICPVMRTKRVCQFRYFAR